MVLSFIVGIALILIVGAIYYFWKQTEEIELEGIILRKMYEAVGERYYFVIEVNGHGITYEYCEYTCDKVEWMKYNEDERIICGVYFFFQETIINSIKKA